MVKKLERESRGESQTKTMKRYEDICVQSHFHRIDRGAALQHKRSLASKEGIYIYINIQGFCTLECTSTAAITMLR